MRILTILFLLSHFLGVTGCAREVSSTRPPTAQNGILDLRQWDPARDGPVKLKGEWEFYWQKLLTEQDFQNSADPRRTGLLE